jgi:hypothetical protein
MNSSYRITVILSCYCKLLPRYSYIFSVLVKLFVIKLLEKKVVGLERGPLSLVSTTEELLDRKIAAPV